MPSRPSVHTAQGRQGLHTSAVPTSRDIPAGEWNASRWRELTAPQTALSYRRSAAAVPTRLLLAGLRDASRVTSGPAASHVTCDPAWPVAFCSLGSVQSGPLTPPPWGSSPHGEAPVSHAECVCARPPHAHVGPRCGDSSAKPQPAGGPLWTLPTFRGPLTRSPPPSLGSPQGDHGRSSQAFPPCQNGSRA